MDPNALRAIASFTQTWYALLNVLGVPNLPDVEDLTTPRTRLQAVEFLLQAGREERRRFNPENPQIPFGQESQLERLRIFLRRECDQGNGSVPMADAVPPSQPSTGVQDQPTAEGQPTAALPTPFASAEQQRPIGTTGSIEKSKESGVKSSSASSSSSSATSENASFPKGHLPVQKANLPDYSDILPPIETQKPPEEDLPAEREEASKEISKQPTPHPSEYIDPDTVELDLSAAVFHSLAETTRGMKAGERNAAEKGLKERHLHLRLVGEEVGISMKRVSEKEWVGSKRPRKHETDNQGRPLEHRPLPELPAGSPVWMRMNVDENYHCLVNGVSLTSERDIEWAEGFGKDLCRVRCKYRYTIGKAIQRLETAGFITKADARIQSYFMGAYAVAVAMARRVGLLPERILNHLHWAGMPSKPLPLLQIERQEEVFKYCIAFEGHYRGFLPLSQANPTVLAFYGWLTGLQGEGLVPPRVDVSDTKHRDALGVALHKILVMTGPTADRGCVRFLSCKQITEAILETFDANLQLVVGGILPKNLALLEALSPYANYVTCSPDRQEPAKAVLDLPNDSIYAPRSAFHQRSVETTGYWAIYAKQLFGKDVPAPPSKSTPRATVRLQASDAVNDCCDLYVPKIKYFRKLPPWDIFVAMEQVARAHCAKGKLEELKELFRRADQVIGDMIAKKLLVNPHALED